MEQTPIRLGPLALLLTVISICLTVLAILTFSTARADLALAERYAQTVQTRYDLESQGQSFLAAARPGQEQTFTEDGMRLTVALDSQGNVCRWTLEKDWEQTETIDGLWSGQ